VIAAIAIPNLLRSRMSANEASAVSSLRSINTAQVAYSTAYPSVGYASDLSNLKPPSGSNPPDATSADLLDPILACASQPCTKSGYEFSIVNATGTPVSAYGLQAVPVTQGQTGMRGFCSDQLAVIMADPSGGTNCTAAVQ
jgi:type II secretory pathway pseudopilin PulG